MYTTLSNYKSVREFAKTYKRANGKIGVSRTHIFNLINEERANVGTTGIDVLFVDGSYFVKASQPDEKPRKAKP